MILSKMVLLFFKKNKISIVLEKDKANALDKVNDVFNSMIERQGVFKSIDYIVNKILI